MGGGLEKQVLKRKLLFSNQFSGYGAAMLYPNEVHYRFPLRLRE